MTEEPAVKKQKYPAPLALALARKLVHLLAPCCERIEIAGSLRRRKPEVGDIEILYVPRQVEAPDPNDLFGDKKIFVNAIDVALAMLIKMGKLEKRPKTDGSLTWGPQIKLARAIATGIPVDFFAADRDNWFNLLVCRTGSKENNILISQGADKLGWEWKPYTVGFISKPNAIGERFVKRCRSERDVFEGAGLPYREPWER